MNKNLLNLMLIAIIAITFSACKKDEQTSPNNTTSDITSLLINTKWNAKFIRSAEIENGVVLVDDTTYLPENFYIYDFRKNDTLIVSEMGELDTASYKITNNNMVITMQNPASAISLKTTLSNINLKLESIYIQSNGVDEYINITELYFDKIQ